ncbi:DEKNAAC101582 [Brettanomyces naardenensis]|uniref:Vacuolar protein sorting-associated protein 27 n=1 Tax=Brettanomyces naardenensis TaxID=13370 RepID=A0A448YIC6_BRENA|nr:DEKNAAC101582 [Brettanomyces naardenensis]
MSWFSDTSEVHPLIEDATSESIPNGDIDFAVALEISDYIRSKRVASKDAMRSLKKRFLSTKNPNQQRSALKLMDFCIKNGGEHFLLDIASKEFMDPLVGILHDKELNSGVKEYLLELIQSWSIMFSTHPKLSYVNDVYKKLQNEGFQFPEIIDYVDSSLIESKVAPEWEDSDACMLCSKLFTFLNRKHHCRSCGGVFCQEHSSKSCELPELGITIPVRVCDTCYQEHMDKFAKQQKKTDKKKKSSKHKSHAVNDEDADLKKAIELSLKEAGMGPTSQLPEQSSSINPPAYEDEDEAMKAAIAASLADFRQENAPAVSADVQSAPQSVPQNSFYSDIFPETKTEASVVNDGYKVPSYENNRPQTSQPAQPSTSSITPVEENNVVLFVRLLDNYVKAPARPITEESAIQQMYGSIQQLQQKIAQELAKERNGLDKYQDMYSKLFAIGKVYDDILQTRLIQQSERQRNQYGSFAQPAQQSFSQQSQPSYPPPFAQTSFPPPPSQFSPPQQSPQPQSPPVQKITERPSMPLPSEVSYSPSFSPANGPSSPPVGPRLSSIGSIQYSAIPQQQTEPQLSPSSPYYTQLNHGSSISGSVTGSVAKTPEKEPEPVNLIDL